MITSCLCCLSYCVFIVFFKLLISYLLCLGFVVVDIPSNLYIFTLKFISILILV